jgi:hypothetical protein
MAAQSFLAKLGTRLSTLGSAGSLAFAFPLAEGGQGMDAHTAAARIGFYAVAATKIGVVVNGVESLDIGPTTITANVLVTTPAVSAAGAGLNIGQGAAAPSSPNNGDVWITSTGMYAQVNGATVGPFGVSGGGTVTGTGAISRVAFWSGASSLTSNANFTFTTTSGLHASIGVGSLNEMLGTGAGNSTLNGNSLVLVGNSAGVSLTSASNATLVGASAGFSLTTGAGSSAFGNLALFSCTIGSNNTAVGYQALKSQVSSGGCVAVGDSALIATTAANNTAVGNTALQSLTSGTQCSAVGANALQQITTNGDATAVGYNAGTNPSGNQNTFIGSQAGVGGVSSTAQTCTGIGYKALFAITSGSASTALGVLAGSTQTTATNCSFIGYGAGDSTAVGATGHFVVGSNSAAISTLFIGNGETNAAPQNILYNATGGSGSNIAGASFTIAGGIGTGTGIGGSVLFQVAPAGSSGSTANTLTTALTIDQLSNVVPGTAALSTSATNGFTYVQSCAGTPTGTPAGSYAGRIPLVYNTSANTLYFYNAGWQSLTGAYLLKANNLSDVASVLTSRANIGIDAYHAVADAAYSIAVADQDVTYTSLTAARTANLPLSTTVNPGKEYVLKDGTGSAATYNITLAVQSGEYLDGVLNGTLNITTNYGRLRVFTNGAGQWYSQSASANVQVFLAGGSTTWVKPPWATVVTVTLIAPGGAGGSGSPFFGASTSGSPVGGGGGGGSGGVSSNTFPASSLPSTVTVTMPTAPAGGAAVTATVSGTLYPGNSGGAAVTASFGTYLTATSGGPGGGGITNAGGTSAGGTAGTGSFAGAAGTAGSQSITTPTQPTTSANGPGGGAGGAGFQSNGGGPTAGGTGGNSPRSAGATGGGTAGVSGTPNGGAGTTILSGAAVPGAGGGGGWATDTTNDVGAPGGLGGSYGGGGGGGSAAIDLIGQTGAVSGVGGNGGPGIIVVTSYS